MRTLSIRQPWAWLVAHGHLHVVNAAATTYRGPVLIRSGLALTQRLHQQVAEHAIKRWRVNIPAFNDLPRGGVVGAAMLVGVGVPSEDHWSAPEFDAGLVLAAPVSLPLHKCVPAWTPATQFYDVPLHTLPERSQWLVREMVGDTVVTYTGG